MLKATTPGGLVVDCAESYHLWWTSSGLYCNLSPLCGLVVDHTVTYCNLSPLCGLVVDHTATYHPSVE